MSVWMVGIDHNRAQLDVRSVFSFTRKRAEQAYVDFKALPGVEGCVILSTCNRMELWLSVSERADFSPADMLCSYLQVSPAEYAPYFVERRQQAAMDHLFRLAAGLESQIMGEDQIITQVGEALALARSCYATDHTLEVLFRLAITAGKRVKTETDLSTADRSVIHAALDVLAGQGITVAGRRCLVIGNGMMGRLTAQTLLEQGADVTVTVRRYRSGVVDIPFGCKRINYDERMDLLPACDLVVSATSSPNYTLRCRELAALTVDHPIPLIDLAVPRDIEPEAGSLPWATLYDIDSFRIDLQSDKLRLNLHRAESILQEEEERFLSWYENRSFASQIQRLKDSTGSNVCLRMTPFFRQVPLDEEQKKRLDREVSGASARMMNHLLFGLRARLPDRVFRECLDAMEQIFSE